MATATPETQTLGCRSQQQAEQASPVDVTEKAAREVNNIVFDQRVKTLSDLAPELVNDYRSLRQGERPPTLNDLLPRSGMTEQQLVQKLGSAAAGKVDYVINDYRDAYRAVQVAKGRAPTAAELAEQANVPEADLVNKLGNEAAAILRQVYLRLRVVGGGCSGFQNKLDLDPRATDKDDTFEMHGVPIVVDKRSLMYLTGVTVDFHDEINRRGFSVTNPQAKTTCGCGSSYSM